MGPGTLIGRVGLAGVLGQYGIRGPTERVGAKERGSGAEERGSGAEEGGSGTGEEASERWYSATSRALFSATDSIPTCRHLRIRQGAQSFLVASVMRQLPLGSSSPLLCQLAQGVSALRECTLL